MGRCANKDAFRLQIHALWKKHIRPVEHPVHADRYGRWLFGWLPKGKLLAVLTLNRAVGQCVAWCLPSDLIQMTLDDTSPNETKFFGSLTRNVQHSSQYGRWTIIYAHHHCGLVHSHLDHGAEGPRWVASGEQGRIESFSIGRPFAIKPRTIVGAVSLFIQFLIAFYWEREKRYKHHRISEKVTWRTTSE